MTKNIFIPWGFDFHR